MPIALAADARGGTAIVAGVGRSVRLASAQLVGTASSPSGSCAAGSNGQITANPIRVGIVCDGFGRWVRNERFS